METTDIVIHKGEKEEKYQLFVEDYVMSYLKNYRSTVGRSIFFFGKREQKENKYYIFGAGREKDISYFANYIRLDEITCRYVMDMPVFSVKEEEGSYELAGYNIFYQSNEAMQSYMVEQRRAAESEEKDQNRGKTQRKGRTQNTTEGQALTEAQTSAGMQSVTKGQTKTGAQNTAGVHRKTKYSGMAEAQSGGNASEKQGHRLMTVQLSAIFIILAAIVINSTNSYTKLNDLGLAAIEVFFAMENQEASDMIAGGEKMTYMSDINTTDEAENVSDMHTESDETANASDLITNPFDEAGGTTLRLEELDAKFEEENQAAKEEENMADESETERSEKEQNGTEKNETEKDEMEGNITEKNEIENSDTENNKMEEDRKKTDVTEEASSVEQAFARSFAEYYQIEKGDTLCSISIKLYGDDSKVNDICELNQITDPDCIKYGQKILLP